MKKMYYLIGAGILCIALALGTSFAYDQIIKAETIDGIPYATGGVGKEERAAMEKMSRDYNLKIVFAKQNGAFLVQIPVFVRNMQGNVLIETQSNGPWFMTKIPKGQYKITAGPRPNEKTRTITVGEKCKTVRFVWQR
jgi:hypothetical protein